MLIAQWLSIWACLIKHVVFFRHFYAYNNPVNNITFLPITSVLQRFQSEVTFCLAEGFLVETCFVTENSLITLKLLHRLRLMGKRILLRRWFKLGSSLWMLFPLNWFDTSNICLNFWLLKRISLKIPLMQVRYFILQTLY